MTKIPGGLFKVFQPTSFFAGPGNILNGVTQAKSQVPGIKYFDDFVGGISTIMGRMIYRLFLFHDITRSLRICIDPVPIFHFWSNPHS